MPRDQMSRFAMCMLAVKALSRHPTQKSTIVLKCDKLRYVKLTNT